MEEGRWENKKLMDDECRITNKKLLVADFSLRSFRFKLIPWPLLLKREGEGKSLSFQERDLG
jgi:hypothetical protein